MLLTGAYSGFWTVCKSPSGWPFLLIADWGMLWVLNRLYVSIWPTIPTCCWHEHALGFEQVVSQHLASPSCLLLTRECYGFRTGCKSAPGKLVLVANMSMLLVLNSLLVSIWLTLSACCWQEHVLCFEQGVSLYLPSFSCLLPTRPCCGFYTECKSGSGWPFLLVADKSMLWISNRM